MLAGLKLAGIALGIGITIGGSAAWTMAMRWAERRELREQTASLARALGARDAAGRQREVLLKQQSDQIQEDRDAIEQLEKMKKDLRDDIERLEMEKGVATGLVVLPERWLRGHAKGSGR